MGEALTCEGKQGSTSMDEELRVYQSEEVQYNDPSSYAHSAGSMPAKHETKRGFSADAAAAAAR